MVTKKEALDKGLQFTSTCLQPLMGNNGLFIQPQEELTEEVNLRLFVLPKARKINKEISEFVRELE